MFSKFSTGVCVLLVEENKLLFKGLTINSFSSVSLDPLLISFSMKSNSRFFIDFDRSKNFSINILSEKQKDIAKKCSISGGYRFSFGEIKVAKAGYVPDCLVSMFCRVKEVFQGGDHAIMLCEVVDMLQHQHDLPLVFFDSQYCSVSL